MDLENAKSDTTRLTTRFLPGSVSWAPKLGIQLQVCSPGKAQVKIFKRFNQVRPDRLSWQVQVETHSCLLKRARMSTSSQSRCVRGATPDLPRNSRAEPSGIRPEHIETVHALPHRPETSPAGEAYHCNQGRLLEPPANGKCTQQTFAQGLAFCKSLHACSAKPRPLSAFHDCAMQLQGQRPIRQRTPLQYKIWCLTMSQTLPTAATFACSLHPLALPDVLFAWLLACKM